MRKKAKKSSGNYHRQVKKEFMTMMKLPSQMSLGNISEISPIVPSNISKHVNETLSIELNDIDADDNEMMQIELEDVSDYVNANYSIVIHYCYTT